MYTIALLIIRSLEWDLTPNHPKLIFDKFDKLKSNFRYTFDSSLIFTRLPSKAVHFNCGLVAPTLFVS